MLESLMCTSTKDVIPPVPDTPGTIYRGGFYVGKIRVNGDVYALILAPKEGGQDPIPLIWANTNDAHPGTTSMNDGWSNTQALVALGIDNFQAAKFCKGLTIGGFNDWYLPSVDEVEMIYRAFKPYAILNNVRSSGAPNGVSGYNPSSVPIGVAYTPSNPAQTTVTAFIEGNSEAIIDVSGSMWTSTQSPIVAYPWMQNFTNGYQVQSKPKTASNITRAVRRELIE